jgi:hypothetical protein
MPTFTDMSTWTETLGHSHLKTFTDEEGRFWIEQNPRKSSRWAQLMQKGYAIAWEFESPGGPYTGRVLIDGVVYSSTEAAEKLRKE